MATTHKFGIYENNLKIQIKFNLLSQKLYIRIKTRQIKMTNWVLIFDMSLTGS